MDSYASFEDWRRGFMKFSIFKESLHFYGGFYDRDGMVSIGVRNTAQTEIGITRNLIYPLEG